jgi:hypothetical protein
MTDNNGINRDENGKFVPGNKVSNKKRDRTQTDKLITALKKAGNKRGQKFWDVVAEKAFIDKEIMKLVVSKLVPNISEVSGKDGSPLNITLQRIRYSKDEADNN